jgi:hypothetical protein
MRRQALVGLLLIACACGSVRPPAAPAPVPSGNTGSATVRGHLSWPDCAGTACPSLAGVPVHFADPAANRTYTALADGSGGYAIQVPPGSYLVIAGNADRSPYQRQLSVRAGDDDTLDLTIALPTGRS